VILLFVHNAMINTDHISQWRAHRILLLDPFLFWHDLLWIARCAAFGGGYPVFWCGGLTYRAPDCVWRVCVVDFPGVRQVGDWLPQEEPCGCGGTRRQWSTIVQEWSLARPGVVGGCQPILIAAVGSIGVRGLLSSKFDGVGVYVDVLAVVCQFNLPPCVHFWQLEMSIILIRSLLLSLSFGARFDRQTFDKWRCRLKKSSSLFHFLYPRSGFDRCLSSESNLTSFVHFWRFQLSIESHSGRDGDLKKRHDGAWSGTPLDFWNLSETIFKKHIIVPKLNTRVDSAIGNTGLTQAARSDLLILTTVIKNKPRIILLFVLCNVI